MHVMFEVYLTPGASASNLLTQETIEDTQAQLMTRAEAEKAGFQGIPDDPQDRPRCFVVIRRRDQNRIQNVLDAHPEVTGFKIHDFDV